MTRFMDRIPNGILPLVNTRDLLSKVSRALEDNQKSTYPFSWCCGHLVIQHGVLEVFDYEGAQKRYMFPLLTAFLRNLHPQIAKLTNYA